MGGISIHFLFIMYFYSFNSTTAGSRVSCSHHLLKTAVCSAYICPSLVVCHYIFAIFLPRIELFGILQASSSQRGFSTTWLRRLREQEEEQRGNPKTKWASSVASTHSYATALQSYVGKHLAWALCVCARVCKNVHVCVCVDI
jgi:hypothetical protein